MEILRFAENDNFGTRRRKSSRVWVFLAFFGVVLGVGSAFASSTIAINGNNKVDLGQGVSVVTACDTAIGVRAQSGINSTALTAPTPSPSAEPTFPALTFSLNSLTLSGIDSTSAGCYGKYLDVQIFHTVGISKSPYTCSELGLTGVKLAGSAVILSDCDGATNTLYAKIDTDQGPSANLVFSFSGAPSDISDITVVSRDA
ncbi:MAG: hypothetical protein WCJ89_03880 [Actinomycetes bacterium]